MEFSTPSKRFNLALPGALLNEVFGGCEGEGLAIDIAPAGARPEARQGRLQSLLRRARAGGRAVGGPPGAISIAGA